MTDSEKPIDDTLEHDSAEEARAAGKHLRAPIRDKAIHEPPASKAHEHRSDLKARAGREEQPWLHPDNPAIWDGNHDAE